MTYTKANINAWDCFENDMPINVYCAKTNELIGTFKTIAKAAYELIGRSPMTIHNQIRRQKQTGKQTTFKTRDGRKCFAVKIEQK